MKQKLIFALVGALALLAALAPQTARADEPTDYCATAPQSPNCRLQQEPFLYGMIHCSGLSPIELANSKMDFDYHYGLEKGFAKDDPRWQGTFRDRAREFGATVFCGAPFSGDENNWHYIGDYRFAVTRYLHYWHREME